MWLFLFYSCWCATQRTNSRYLFFFPPKIRVLCQLPASSKSAVEQHKAGNIVKCSFVADGWEYFHRSIHFLSGDGFVSFCSFQSIPPRSSSVKRLVTRWQHLSTQCCPAFQSDDVYLMPYCVMSSLPGMKSWCYPCTRCCVVLTQLLHQLHIST